MKKEKKKKILWLALVSTVVLAAVGLLLWKIGIPMVRLASDPDAFRTWVRERGILGRLAYVGMVVLQTVVAFIPGEPFEIVAGYAFGAWEGSFLCLFASVIGSLCVFLLVRMFGRRIAEIFFSKDKLDSLSFLKTSQNKETLFFFIFMLPGTPKDLLCYFAGLTDISFFHWLLICSVGRLPSILTSTLGGNAIGEKNYWQAILIFSITILVSGLGLLCYRYYTKKHRVPDNSEPRH